MLFDAGCSSDDRTPASSLEARWDFQNDGTWDTPIRPAGAKARYVVPEILGGTSWEVRCQVFDEDSLSTIDVVRLPLPENLPKPPDILLGRLTVEVDRPPYEVDTVHVGEAFGLSAGESCIADYRYGPYRIEYRQGDEVIYEQVSYCQPWDPVFCHSFGKVGFVINEEGTYTLTIVANPDSALFETDYTNNRVTGSVVVIP